MMANKSFFAIATDIGGRNENQDRAFAMSLNGRTLLVLADGMGGHRGGAMASQAIIEVAERLFRANSAQDPNILLPQIVNESCNVIARENVAQNLDGHSTCVLALIDEKACLSWLRIGDSRLFIFADKTHWWRSIDHTMLDLRVLKGELTDEESRHHPDRPFVFRSVSNTAPDMKVQCFGTLPLGAVLFLCSDGVWDAFPAQELYKVTKGENINLITSKIVKSAVTRNGINSDNCTALLYRAPFGDAKLNLQRLNLEELHSLPCVTASKSKFEKKILISVISAFALIAIVAGIFLFCTKTKPKIIEQEKQENSIFHNDQPDGTGTNNVSEIDDETKTPRSEVNPDNIAPNSENWQRQERNLMPKLKEKEKEKEKEISPKGNNTMPGKVGNSDGSVTSLGAHSKNSTSDNSEDK